jgi:hypothetical protein
MTSRIYEVSFTFTPPPEDEETVNGNGYITVMATSEEEALKVIEQLLEEVTDLEVTSIQPLADVPNDVFPHEAHQRLQ